MAGSYRHIITEDAAKQAEIDALQAEIGLWERSYEDLQRGFMAYVLERGGEIHIPWRAQAALPLGAVMTVEHDVHPHAVVVRVVVPSKEEKA